MFDNLKLKKILPISEFLSLHFKRIKIPALPARQVRNLVLRYQIKYTLFKKNKVYFSGMILRLESKSG